MFEETVDVGLGVRVSSLARPSVPRPLAGPLGGGEQACFPQSSITWEILWLSCGLAIGQVTERCFLPGALILVLLDALGVVCAPTRSIALPDEFSWTCSLSWRAFRVLDRHESALRRPTPGS